MFRKPRKELPLHLGGPVNRRKLPLEAFRSTMMQESHNNWDDPNPLDRPHDQLPHLEEARHWVNSHRGSNRHDGTRKRRIVLCGVVLVISFIIFISVRVARNNYDSGTSTSKERYEAVLEYLSDYSDPKALRTKGTPQYRAALWMANVDPLRYDVPTNEFVQHFRQRYALVVFYYAMGGDAWSEHWGFLSDKNECFWNVVTVVKESYIPMGVTCDDDQEILTIVNEANNLSGNLPSELRLLTNLNFFWVPDNSIVGTIPDELQELSNMDSFNVDKNQLHGTLPAWFGKWKQATMLSLQHNRFTGSIPTELGELTMIMRLQFENNQLRGSIPTELLRMKDLQRLFLGRNELEGELTPWLASDIEELSGLGLNNNKFSGSLPAALGKLMNLQRLSLDGNTFTGDVSVLNSLTNLEALFLQNNVFEERIDRNADFLKELKNLRILDASQNTFYGRLPLHMLTHERLETLDMQQNSLSGTLPPDIRENTVLQYLNLNTNIIRQQIPSTISNLKALRHLDLSVNQFGGNLTSKFGSMRQLTHLSIAGNSIEAGQFPEFLRALKNLKELSFRHSNLKGSIPEWLNKLTHLALLDLDYNDLTGTIPVTLGEVTALKYLLLNRNQLNGTVPQSIQDLPELRVALLSENNITGSVGSLCNGESLAEGLDELYTDCGGDTPEVTCPCCTVCCQDGTETCSDTEMLANNWISPYNRLKWAFTDSVDEVF